MAPSNVTYVLKFLFFFFLISFKPILLYLITCYVNKKSVQCQCIFYFHITQRHDKFRHEFSQKGLLKMSGVTWCNVESKIQGHRS